MQLKDAMLDQLAIARRIIRDGNPVVPAWRIGCADCVWIVLTRFDHDNPGQRDRPITLMKRFMAWKLAQSFILTAETWLAPVETRESEEAITSVGASRSQRLGVLQVIGRKSAERILGRRYGFRPRSVIRTIGRSCPGARRHSPLRNSSRLHCSLPRAGNFPRARFDLFGGRLPLARPASSWPAGPPSKTQRTNRRGSHSARPDTVTVVRAVGRERGPQRTLAARRPPLEGRSGGRSGQLPSHATATAILGDERQWE